MSYIDIWSTLWLAMLSVWTSKPKLASGCCERLCDVTGRLPRTDCRLVVEFQAFSWTLVHVTEIQEGLQLWCDEKHHSKWNESDSKFRKIQWSLSHKGNGNRLGMHSIFMEGLLAPWTWPPLVPHPVVEVFIGFHMFFFSIVYFKSFLHHFFSLFAIASVVAPHFFVRFQHLRRAGGTPGSHCAKQKEIETSTAWRQLLEIEMV